MKFVRIDPPGSWCSYQAILEMLSPIKAKSFIDVGCGKGDLSKRLCEQGMVGIGIDFSQTAVNEARKTLTNFIQTGQYKLVQTDIREFRKGSVRQDVAVSLMVMEHIKEDVDFLENIVQVVKPGGYVIVGVPGRKDKWGPEDDTVGHVRRYERWELKSTMETAGLQNVEVWSVGVPTANWLLYFSNLLIKKNEVLKKKKLSPEEQTKLSGVRDIPYKTVFPSWFRMILNKYTMYPLFVLQRIFYKSNLGLIMLGRGETSSTER